MGMLDALNHLLNFGAPALALALVMPGLARLIVPRTTSQLSFLRQSMLQFAVCLAVLIAGLWFFGRDGKMATYLAMAVVCATTQWWMQRAWKR